MMPIDARPRSLRSCLREVDPEEGLGVVDMDSWRVLVVVVVVLDLHRGWKWPDDRHDHHHHHHHHHQHHHHDVLTSGTRQGG